MPARLEIALKPGSLDAEGEALRKNASDAFGLSIDGVDTVSILTFDTSLSDADLESVRREIFTNPVTQVSSFTPTERAFDWAVWIGLRPGVRDAAGSTAQEAIESFTGREFAEEEAIYTSKLYFLRGKNLKQEDTQLLAQRLLANELIHEWKVIRRSDWKASEGIGMRIPKVQLKHEPTVTEIPLNSDEEVLRISAERGLFLNPQDIQPIRHYFNRDQIRSERGKYQLGTAPTDVELEYIAQARSDHCNHNTFRGTFHYKDMTSGETQVVKNLFKTCIQQPTKAIQEKKPWVVSVLWDNAGVARFDDKYNYTITGETHNSPSNMEAYGGSLTGIVGVYRDPLGTGKGSRLVMGAYGFCVGPRDYDGPLKPTLHPRRLLDGVIEGVKDGGNKSGVPTPSGFLYFDEGYIGKCVVLVAAVGIMPAEVDGEPTHLKKPNPGDLVVMVGGRVGIDGIHGVTASSQQFSDDTPAGHVQIGDPYTQKKMHDFILEARDESLMSFVTDNGGGGLSSSIGESAQLCGGCRVELDKVPLKYNGLDQWQIWVSESQERMTVAVPPQHIDKFIMLSRKHDVESTVIGEYTDSGYLHLNYKGKTCAYMDVQFLEGDFPAWEFEAEWTPPEARGLSEPILTSPKNHVALLKDVLARPNICSREWITRQYDHEVQGGSVIKPLVGVENDTPSDAAVLRPVLGREGAIAFSMALNPSYSKVDAYAMTMATFDEAVRKLIAVGADPEQIGAVDNFCWPTIQYDAEQNRDGKFKAAQLVRSNWALKEFCEKAQIPLLSGKDSMYLDGHIEGAYGERHKISAPETLVMSATSVVNEVGNCLTMEVKSAGDLLYLLGETADELGGSAYYGLMDEVGLHVPQTDLARNLALYKDLAKSIQAEMLRSCHGIYSGGLAVHLAQVAFGGMLGLEADLSNVAWRETDGSADKDDVRLLYSESTGRFLVTVAPENKDAFEKQMTSHACVCIGQVIKEPRLRVQGLQGQSIIDESLAELKAIWKAPFGGLV